uniref:Anion exchange protein n=1 Tax=Electrophorus electricus TaxID=8005 RepID=A0A4W4HAZ5_ELEEL
MMDHNQQGHMQEMGQWAGYKENYDPEAGHWGLPRISYLTFKSLVQVYRTMETGVVLLDVEERSLSGIAEKIVDEMVTKKEIRPEDRDGLLQAVRQSGRNPCWQSQRSDVSCSWSPGLHTSQRGFWPTPLYRHSPNPEGFEAVAWQLERPAMALVQLREAAVLDALQALGPVRLLFLLVGPTKSEMDYHDTGHAMAALLADKVRGGAQVQGDREVADAVASFMDCSVVIPPTEIQNEAMLAPIIGFQKKLLQERLRPHDSQPHLDFKPRKLSSARERPEEDPLLRSGIPFGGVIRDVKRRYRHYVSDITDGLNAQVLAAVIFIYFAALSPAITFGGLLADKVDNMMGVSELMLSTAVQGVIFCLLAAQPVLIIGFSGPLLVFEEAFYGFCRAQDVEYLVGRVWIGMWLMVIVVLTVALEGSFLVRFISRFTQEIFSILISLIFIYETFTKLANVLTHPVVVRHTFLDGSTGNVTTATSIRYRSYPNTALLSMCLMFGCFSIAYFLRIFKNGYFLPGKVRRLMGDFGVPIAILLMVAVDISINDTYTQKLVVPQGLQVSNPAARGWLINPTGERKPFPVWMMIACVVPAFLVFILIFLESQITTLIISKPERKMVKGSGFHLDLLILVILGGCSALFGMPWLSATTVRSVTHANALTVMSKGPKPQIERVLEQRVSGVLVAILVGLSIFMEPILKMIPMPALFGIFLYMGITSLSGIQLWDRILLLLVPKKYHPNEPYATRVMTSRMHMFTAIQVVCLAMLWTAKSSVLSLALPFILILTVPLRMYMTGRVFTQLEMKCLDADDAKATFEEEPGVDMYSETRMPA